MVSTTTTTTKGSLPPFFLLFSPFFLLIIGITIHEAHQQEAIVTITNITKAWNSLWASNYKQKEKNTKAMVATPIVVDILLLKQQP
jgi:hypothetical protein